MSENNSNPLNYHFFLFIVYYGVAC